MKKVTVWYKVKYNEHGEMMGAIHNHVEDGWSTEEKPLPLNSSFTNQLAWSKDEWIKEHKYMSDDYVIVD